MSNALPPERCRQIARWVLGNAEITAMADDIGRFVATAPPPTQEQLDKIAILLRPAPRNQ